MEINTLNINSAFVETVNSDYVVTGVRKVSNFYHNTDYNTFKKTAEEEKINILVTENISNTTYIQEYNLRLQANSQLANPERTQKVFNDSKKGNIKFPKNSLRNQVSNDIEEEDFSEELKIGTGYYIVINNKENYSVLNRIKSNTNLMYEKIKEAYKLGFKKEPGTLVNLLY